MYYIFFLSLLVNLFWLNLLLFKFTVDPILNLNCQNRIWRIHGCSFHNKSKIFLSVIILFIEFCSRYILNLIDLRNFESFLISIYKFLLISRLIFPQHTIKFFSGLTLRSLCFFMFNWGVIVLSFLPSYFIV